MSLFFLFSLGGVRGNVYSVVSREIQARASVSVCCMLHTFFLFSPAYPVIFERLMLNAPVDGKKTDSRLRKGSRIAYHKNSISFSSAKVKYSLGGS